METTDFGRVPTFGGEGVRPEPPANEAPAPTDEQPVYLPPASVVSRRKRPDSLRLPVAFLLSAAVGALLAGVGEGGVAGALDLLTDGFLTGRLDSGFFSICLRSFSANVLMLSAIGLCGFGAVGQPFAIAVLLFKGLGLGMSMGYFYTSLGAQGILASLLLLAPCGALSGYALILGCRESLKFSNTLLRAVFGGISLDSAAAKTYGVKFLVLLLMLLLSALLDGACSKLFAPLFSALASGH